MSTQWSYHESSDVVAFVNDVRPAIRVYRRVGIFQFAPAEIGTFFFFLPARIECSLFRSFIRRKRSSFAYFPDFRLPFFPRGEIRNFSAFPAQQRPSPSAARVSNTIFTAYPRAELHIPTYIYIYHYYVNKTFFFLLYIDTRPKYTR